MNSTRFPPAWNGENPVDIFHTLLERENAKSFRDQFLDFPLRADWAIWIFTANDPDKIPATILDRLLVLPVRPLQEEQMRAFVGQRLEEAIGAYGGAFRAELDHQALDSLARAPTREMLRIIDVAIGIAAAAGRARVLPADVLKAEKLCSAITGKRRFGFL